MSEQAAPQVRGIRPRVARRAERHQPVEIEVRAPLGALTTWVVASIIGGFYILE